MKIASVILLLCLGGCGADLPPSMSDADSGVSAPDASRNDAGPMADAGAPIDWCAASNFECRGAQVHVCGDETLGSLVEDCSVDVVRTECGSCGGEPTCLAPMELCSARADGLTDRPFIVSGRGCDDHCTGTIGPTVSGLGFRDATGARFYFSIDFSRVVPNFAHEPTDPNFGPVNLSIVSASGRPLRYYGPSATNVPAEVRAPEQGSVKVQWDRIEPGGQVIIELDVYAYLDTERVLKHVTGMFRGTLEAP